MTNISEPTNWTFVPLLSVSYCIAALATVAIMVSGHVWLSDVSFLVVSLVVLFVDLIMLLRRRNHRNGSNEDARRSYRLWAVVAWCIFLAWTAQHIALLFA
jgi:hypothetical protein